MQRYFSEQQTGHSFTLTPEDSYHLLKVMRKKIHDQIEVVSKGKLYLCEIADITGQLVTAQIIEEQTIEDVPMHVTIAQALVSETKMDFILQKGVELGAKAFLPFVAERSVVRPTGKEDKKLFRWQRIVKEASEQSKRRSIPQVYPLGDVDKLCKVECELKLLCTVNETSTTIKKALENYQKDDRIIIVVGPEGGFTKEEENKLLAAGYQAVSLGNLVLRTETVGLYVMSIINYYFMR